MSEFKDFFERLQQSVIDDEFVKLTLSRPLRKSEGLINVYARLFVVEGKTVFQFKYRHTEEELYKQFSLPEAIAEIEELLTNSFRGGTLFTLKEDLLLVVSKKKKVSYRENAPSFKNKLPDVPLES